MYSSAVGSVTILLTFPKLEPFSLYIRAANLQQESLNRMSKALKSIDVNQIVKSIKKDIPSLSHSESIPSVPSQINSTFNKLSSPGFISGLNIKTGMDTQYFLHEYRRTIAQTVYEEYFKASKERISE